MKLLVYHSGALGDFISILPVLSNLRKMYPESSIDIITKPAHGSFAFDNALVNTIIDIDSQRVMMLFKTPAEEIPAEFNNEYSHAFLFARDNSPLTINFKTFFNGSVFSIDPEVPSGKHCVEYHLEILNGLKSFVNTERHVSLSSISSKSSGVDTIIYLHPGSGSVLKNWSVEKFRELASRIKELKYSVCWIKGYCEQNLSFLNDENIYEVESLSDCLKKLSTAALFIGNDSGITHLAAVSGCKVLAIFGPSDPLMWAPKGINDICVVYKKRDCSPCHRKVDIHVEQCKKRCLDEITVDEVFSCVLKMIRP